MNRPAPSPRPRGPGAVARAALETARWGLSAYRGTALALVAVAGTALGAALVVAWFARAAGGALDSRLLLPAAGTALDPSWTLARSPSALQADAVRALFQALAGAGAAALGVGALGVLLIFAARASERVPEFSVRRAVGASGRTLVAAALAEGGAIGGAALAAGGLAGVVLARHAAHAWPGALAPGSAADALPSLVVAWVAALAILAGALLALMFAPRHRLVDAAPARVSLVVPALQLGLALILLTAGGLMTRHAAGEHRAASRRPTGGEIRVLPGFPLDGEVYSGTVAPAAPAVRSARYVALLARLRAGAAFDTVSLTGAGAVIGLGTVSVVTTDCGLCPSGGLLVPWQAVPALHQVVSADTFHSLGIRLLAGRGITDADRWGAPAVAVVSRSLALRHFQNGDAIGRRLLFGDDPRTWHTVVGIVEDRAPAALGGGLLPLFAVYASVLQHPAPSIELMLRPRRGAAEDRPLQSDLRDLFGAGGVPTQASAAALLAAQAAPVAWFGRLLAAEARAALLVALLATLIQMRLWVRSLAPELGLRRALGARVLQVLGLVLGRAAVVGLGGVLVGLVLGPAVWGAFGPVVRGLPAWDAGLLIRFAAPLVTLTATAAAVPAWRAAHVAPAALLGDRVA